VGPTDRKWVKGGQVDPPFGTVMALNSFKWVYNYVYVYVYIYNPSYSML